MMERDLVVVMTETIDSRQVFQGLSDQELSLSLQDRDRQIADLFPLFLVV